MNRVPSFQDVQNAIKRVPSINAIWGDNIQRDGDDEDHENNNDERDTTNSNNSDNNDNDDDDDVTSEHVNVVDNTELRASKIDEIISNSLANSSSSFTTSRTTTTNIPVGGEFVTTDDNVRIFFRRSGHKDAKNCVLLVTGFNSSHEAWSRIEPHFSVGEFQCIILDNRGCGYSDHPVGPYSTERMARDILAIADHVNWQNFTLVGHSMGGMISQHVALLAPSRVGGLMLSCTRLYGGWYNTLPTWSGIYRFLRIRFAANTHEEIHHSIQFLFPYDYLESTCVERGYEFKTNRDWLYDLFRTRKAPKSKEGTQAQLAAVGAHGLDEQQIDRLKNAGFPIHVLCTTEDIVVPSTHSATAAEVLNARLVTIDGIGHAPAMQSPDRFARAIHELVKHASTPK